ncbi:MAG: tetratricopeptide repeat protein [Pseudomonadota bacterium]
MKHLIQHTLAALCLASAAPWALADAAEDSAKAEQEFARGDLIAAIALWTRAAGQGYAPAQARLGDILDKSEDDEDAVDWYRKAAAQNNAAGIYGLGQMYAKGEGVPKDLAQARDLTLRAAKLEHVPAIATLMDALRSGGLGFAVNKAEADAWEVKLIALAPNYRAAPPAPAKGKKKKGAA